MTLKKTAKLTPKGSRKPVIALAQIRYFDNGKTNNIAKIKKFIALAAAAKAEIICFPESCIQKDKFIKISDKLIEEICASCRQHNIWAIIGDTFQKNRRLYNMALLIDRAGNIKGDYSKINLYGDEVEKAGNKIFTFQTDFAKIGIAICWDLAFPDLFIKMKKAGAQIVFNPSYWCYEDTVHERDHKARELILVKSLIQSRAFENLMYIAYVSPLTKENDLISYSAIASPHKILKSILDKEGLIVQTIDLEELKTFEKLYPNKSK
ncbi:MAG: carbon-nitrogen hydrolase family protein [bacterium]|nr:carbon-nitrogen hydrolase family protein [bacterium]